MDLEEIAKDNLTFKDLNLLSDLFYLCYDSYKKTLFSMQFVHNSMILDIYKKAMNLFDNELRIAIDILKEPGGDFIE